MACNGVKQFYKVPLDLSSTTKITDENLLNNKGYFAVHIVVNNLRELGLLMYNNKDEEEGTVEEDTDEEENTSQEEAYGYGDSYLDHDLYEIAHMTILV